MLSDRGDEIVEHWTGGIERFTNSPNIAQFGGGAESRKNKGDNFKGWRGQGSEICA